MIWIFDTEAFRKEIEKWSPRDLAQAIGRDIAAITMRLRRNSAWTGEDIAKLCNAMGTNPASFYRKVKGNPEIKAQPRRRRANSSKD